MSKNQHGFALLEAVLLFIIVAIIGFAGWHVWNSNSKINTSLSNVDATSSSILPKITVVKTYKDCLESKTSTIDKKSFPQTCTSKAGKKFTDPNPYSSWKTYTSETGRYTLKHPASWDAKICEPAAEDLTLYLGPTKASSAICSSGHPAQIWVVSTSAVPTISEQNLGSIYSDRTKKNVRVGGVSGTRQTGKLKEAQEGPVTIPAGTLLVQYIFLTPGRSYILLYLQTPSGDFASDNLKLFDLVVQETLKFN